MGFSECWKKILKQAKVLFARISYYPVVTNLNQQQKTTIDIFVFTGVAVVFFFCCGLWPLCVFKGLSKPSHGMIRNPAVPLDGVWRVFVLSASSRTNFLAIFHTQQHEWAHDFLPLRFTFFSVVISFCVEFFFCVQSSFVFHLRLLSFFSSSFPLFVASPTKSDVITAAARPPTHIRLSIFLLLTFSFLWSFTHRAGSVCRVVRLLKYYVLERGLETPSDISQMLYKHDLSFLI